MSKLVVEQWDRSSGVDPVHIIPDSEVFMYDRAFVFPLECRSEIAAIIDEREKLRKAYVDSMSLVYQFCNKLVRENRR